MHIYTFETNGKEDKIGNICRDSKSSRHQDESEEV